MKTKRQKRNLRTGCEILVDFRASFIICCHPEGKEKMKEEHLRNEVGWDEMYVKQNCLEL